MEAGPVDMRGRPEGELRRSVRFPCSRFACSCTIRPESSSGQPEHHEKRGALLLNICVNGSCFEANFKPTAGTSLYVDLRPIEGPEVKLKIRVVNWRSSEKNGFYIINSKFIEMSERNRQNLLLLIDTISRFQQDLSLA